MAGAGDKAPSTNIRNLNPNLESLDAIINSDAPTIIARETPDNPTGKVIRTIAGANADIDNLIANGKSAIELAIDNAGYDFLDPLTFNTGATITDSNQALKWAVADGGNDEYYRWSGALPKTVPAGSTPDATGGVASGAWRALGSAAIASQLADPAESANRVARMSITADSLVDLLNVPFIAGRTYLNNGFYPTTTIGGGQWKAVSGADLTKNNGGTFVSVEALRDWYNAAESEVGGVTTANLQKNLSVLFAAGAGTGDAFIREGTTKLKTSIFGAINSNSIDNKVALQQALDVSKNIQTKLVNDVPCYASEGLVCKFDFYCEKPIYTDHKYSDNLIHIAHDNEIDITGDVNFSGDLEKGDCQISEILNHAGKTLIIESDEVDFVRLNYSLPYYKKSAHEIVDDTGVITPELPFSYDYTKINSVRLLWSDTEIEVKLWVRVIGDSLAPIDRPYILCTRSGTVFDNPKIENKTDNYVALRTGLVTQDCVNITINTPVIDGFHYPDSRGYPIYLGLSAFTEINNPQIRHSRKSLDGAHANHVTVNGGNLGSAAGTHCGYNYTFNDTTLISGTNFYSGAGVSSAYFGSGGNFKLNNCKAIVHNTTNPSLFGSEPNNPKLSGVLSIDGCELICVNCTGAARIAEKIQLGVEPDYSSDIELPSKVFIRNSLVEHTGDILSLFLQFTDTVNSVVLPEKINITNSDGRSIVEAINDNVESTPNCKWSFEDSSGVSIRLNGNHSVFVDIKRLDGSVRLSPAVHKRVSIYDSTVNSIYSGQYGGTPIRPNDGIISLHGCTLSSDGGPWSARGWYEFSNCYFNSLITWASIDPTVNVIFSSGNRGVSQSPNFDLNGVYRNQ